MTLSEVLLLLTFVSSVAYGVFDITWKISHDDKRYKNKNIKTKKTDRHLCFPKQIGQSFLIRVT
uniref:hypothetical protein n=1 Tax=Faecalibacterium sp. TaxID=1971605 RepID=UPI003FED7118